MNPLRTNAKRIQKQLLLNIGQMLPLFPDAWEMPRVEFYKKLQRELNIDPGNDGDYWKIEHYVRSGFPLPDQSTHEVPIAQEALHKAIENIFNSLAKKQGYDEERKKSCSQKNEDLLHTIDNYYAGIKKLEECMPFFTDNFENYLISHLVYREAWPSGITTQKDRRLLKESLEKYPIKKISHEQQLNISAKDLYKLLLAVEYINFVGNHIEALNKMIDHLQTLKKQKERQPTS